MTNVALPGQFAGAQVSDERPDVAIADVDIPTDKCDVCQIDGLRSIRVGVFGLNNGSTDAGAPRVEPRPMLYILRRVPE